MNTITIDLSGLPIGSTVTVPVIPADLSKEHLPELSHSALAQIESEFKDYPYYLSSKVLEAREELRRPDLIASGKIPTINIIL